MIEKLGAKSLESGELPSLKVLELDEPLSALLLQAINAAVNTNAKGMRNRSLLRLSTGTCPAGWLSVEMPFNVASVVSDDSGSNLRAAETLDVPKPTRVQMSVSEGAP